MRWLKKIFRRKTFKQQPKQLRIDGIRTELTPQPDDAELAAQALLESRIYGDKSQRKAAKKQKASDLRPQASDQPHDAAYYQQLSEKIRTAHEQERRMAMRYVAYCEEKLTPDISHQTSDIAELERGLYKFQDCAEREGGELLRRWQHCLAECIVRQMTTIDNIE